MFSVSLRAHADTFNFAANGSAGGFTGSGTLNATPNGDGSYTVTGITGPGVTGLIAPDQFEGNDNQLFPDDTILLDYDGLSFTDVMGSAIYQVNIYYDLTFRAYYSEVENGDGDVEGPLTTFTVSSVTPEPSSLALLGTGMLGIAGVVRKRFAA